MSGMPEQLLDQARVDRNAFAVETLADAQKTSSAYWRQRTPDDRLDAW